MKIWGMDAKMEAYTPVGHGRALGNDLRRRGTAESAQLLKSSIDDLRCG